ncbi:MAG: hypothetical protein ABFD89_04795 [Bryobacteraceae bacterium]
MPRGRPRKVVANQETPIVGQQIGGLHIPSPAVLADAEAALREQAARNGVVVVDDYDEGRMFDDDDTPPGFPKELPRVNGTGMEPVVPIRISKKRFSTEKLARYATIVTRDLAPKVSERYFDDDGRLSQGDLWVCAISKSIIDAHKRAQLEAKNRRYAPLIRNNVYEGNDGGAMESGISSAKRRATTPQMVGGS